LGSARSYKRGITGKRGGRPAKGEVKGRGSPEIRGSKKVTGQKGVFSRGNADYRIRPSQFLQGDEKKRMSHETNLVKGKIPRERHNLSYGTKKTSQKEGKPKKKKC